MSNERPTEGGIVDRRGLRIGFQVWGQHVAWPDLMDIGAHIDRLGFDAVWSNDHLLPVVGDDSGLHEAESGPVWDAWMTLMGWAALTDRVSLGVMVSSVSYRTPALLVRMVSALDHASDGRAVLGLGAGWNATEHRAFGFEYPGLRERLDRLEEAAWICRAMLDGESASRVGQWYRVEGARVDPPPLQQRLPLLIGGSGERRTLPVVARVADAWNGEGEPADIARKNRLLDQLCGELGRDPGSIRRTVGLPPPLIRPGRAAAVDVLAGQLVRHGLSGTAARAAAADSLLVGPAEQVAERLRAYREAGASEVAFDWPNPSDQATLEALAGEVRPLLA